MRLLERYATAIHATTLKPDANTVWADLDVIGAAGLAAKHEPLGIAISRLLGGGGQGDVLAIMASEAFRRARRLGIKVSRTQARDLSMAVLAWLQNGRCNPCGGTGGRLIPGTPSLGGVCPACRGEGKITFETQFRHEWRELAGWLRNEVERSQANAGVLVMQKIY